MKIIMMIMEKGRIIMGSELEKLNKLVTSQTVQKIPPPKRMELKPLPVDIDIALQEVLTTESIFTPTYGRGKKKVTDAVPVTRKATSLDELCLLVGLDRKLLTRKADDKYVQAFRDALIKIKDKNGKLTAEDFARARKEAAKTLGS